MVSTEKTLVEESSDPIIARTSASKLTPGDVDSSGEIEVTDARNILRAAVGLDKPSDWKTA